MAMFNLSWLCYSQNNKSVPPWLQDSWTVEYTDYHPLDAGNLYPRKKVVKLTITSDYITLSSTTDGVRKSYDFNNEKFKIEYYDRREQKLFGGNSFYLNVDEQRQRPYLVVNDEWGMRQRHFYVRNSEIYQREAKKREEEQRRRQAEQRKKEQLEKIVSEYNDSLRSLIDEYNRLLLQDKYNIDGRRIGSSYNVTSASDESSAKRLLTQSIESIKADYERIRNELKSKYDSERTNNLELFSSQEEFDNAYFSHDYYKIIENKRIEKIDAQIQGKWRLRCDKVKDDYKRLVLKDGEIKIKQLSRTLYKGPYKLTEKELTAGRFSLDICLQGGGRYVFSGFERYYGIDGKMLWFVTKKTLIVIGTTIIGIATAGGIVIAILVSAGV